MAARLQQPLQTPRSAWSPGGTGSNKPRQVQAEPLLGPPPANTTSSRAGEVSPARDPGSRLASSPLGKKKGPGGHRRRQTRRALRSLVGQALGALQGDTRPAGVPARRVRGAGPRISAAAGFRRAQQSARRAPRHRPVPVRASPAPQPIASLPSGDSLPFEVGPKTGGGGCKADGSYGGARCHAQSEGLSMGRRQKYPGYCVLGVPSLIVWVGRHCQLG